MEAAAPSSVVASAPPPTTIDYEAARGRGAAGSEEGKEAEGDTIEEAPYGRNYLCCQENPI